MARRHPHAGPPLMREWTMVALAAFGLYLYASYQPQTPPAQTSAARSTPSVSAADRIPGRNMPTCGKGRRHNCVVDGDTLWLDGEKIRIENINAPEVQGRCARERSLAKKATDRLRALVSLKPLAIDRNGTDQYGRTLATIGTDRGDVGQLLVDEGLAHRWYGHKENWCA